MADRNTNQETDTNASAESRPEAHDSTHDPEFEIPDPEQVERDREKAREIYGSENEKKDDKVA